MRSVIVGLALLGSLGLNARQAAARPDTMEVKRTYSELRAAMLASPVVAAMVAKPELVDPHLRNLDLMGVWPDFAAVDGHRVPVLNIYVCFFVEGITASQYGIAKATFQPVVIGGKAQLRCLGAEVTDMRPAGGAGGEEEKIRRAILAAIPNAMTKEVSGSVDELVRAINDTVGKIPGASVKGFRIDKNAIVLVVGPAGNVGEVAANFDYDDGLPSGPSNCVIGDPQEAALVVDCFYDHLQYYRATLLFRENVLHLPSAHHWATNDGHDGLDGRLLESGLPGLKKKQIPDGAVPGKNIVRFCLQPGQQVADLGGIAAGGKVVNWSNHIGSIVVRPGPKWAGEVLRVHNWPQFDRGHEDNKPAILRSDYHYLRNGDVYRFHRDHRSDEYIFHNIDCFAVVAP